MVNHFVVFVISVTTLLLWSCSSPKCETQEQIKLEYSAKLDTLGQELNSKNRAIDSLNNEIKNQEVRFMSLSQMNLGDLIENRKGLSKEAYGFRYRIDILTQETYKSMFLTKIEYHDEALPELMSSNHVDVEHHLRLKPDQTGTLQFIRWVSPTKFELKVVSNFYEAQIVDDNTIVFAEAKSGYIYQEIF